MKSIAIMVFMFLTLTVGAKAQENQRIFTAEEQAIVDLSNSKWEWMAEKNVEKLAELFHENSQFVHMGGYWGKQQEIETVRTVGIWYQKAVTGVYVMENGRWRLSIPIPLGERC